MEFYIDFRFLDVEYELSALQSYIHLIEDQLPALKETEKDKLTHRIQEFNYDEGDADAEFQQYYDLIDRVIPRYFYGPIVVTAWAIFESSLIEIAEYIKGEEGLEADIKSMKGSSLERIKRYYNDVIKHPIVDSNQDWERIQKILAIRNALAHGNGRKDVVGENTWKKLEGINRDFSILEPYEDYIILNSQTTQEIVDIITRILKVLIKRIRDKY